MIYELVLWIRGERTTLGWFRTKKEAERARRDARKYYKIDDEELQNLFHDGAAGYDIFGYAWGLTQNAAREIDWGKRCKEG